MPRISIPIVLTAVLVASILNRVPDAPAVNGASITVDTTTDDSTTNGNCTLREAIAAANTNAAVDGCLAGQAGLDTIGFNIASTGVHTIQAATPLPDIFEPITIDGYTQNGSSANTNPAPQANNATLTVELNGSLASNIPTLLHILAGPTTIRGLIINGFTASPYGWGPLVVDGGTGTSIEGNFIGTDASGMAAVPNAIGVLINGSSTNTTVGGPSPAARNLVSGNRGWNVLIGSSGNHIEGNLIGTDRSAASPISGVTTNAGVAVSGPAASGNTIGGTADGMVNIISGNGTGIALGQARNNTIQGNLIGTGPSGLDAVGNDRGIEMCQDSTDNLIGGNTPRARNVISASAEMGVMICGGSSSNTLQGNFIGTGADGETVLGNGSHGISVEYSANLNLIGGTGVGEANRVAYNHGDGIRVGSQFGNAPTRNSIVGNSIHDNDGKGIDNVFGGNAELNPPAIDAPGPPLAGTACSGCTIDIYSDIADEGATFEGSATADSSGLWQFSDALTGPQITATARDGDGNTSEFSAPLLLSTSTPTPTPIPVQTSLSEDTPAGATVLQPTDPSGFAARDLIVIDPGGNNEEYSVVNGLGSLDLAAPLQFAHLAGESIARVHTDIPPGDADCSGAVNSVDALRVLRRVAGLEPYSLCWAAGNVGCLDDIDSVDALRILRFVAGLPPNLPAECPAIGVLPND